MILAYLTIKSARNNIIIGIIGLLLVSCGTHKPKKTLTQVQLTKTKQNIVRNPHRYQGSYKIGQPYKINYVKYQPKLYAKYVSTGVASWYGGNDGFHGKLTANGDIYDKNMLTAAHKTLPLPSMVKVTNLHNNKSVLLMVNDRGPFCANRLIDVSEKAAEVLGFKVNGTAKVKVVYSEHETQKLLTKLQLPNTHGKVAVRNILNPSCSVDCYLTKLNNGSLTDDKFNNKTAILAAQNLDKTVISASKNPSKAMSSRLTLLNHQITGEESSIFAQVPKADSIKNLRNTQLKGNNKLNNVAPVALNKISYYVTVGKFKTIAQAKSLSNTLCRYNISNVNSVRVSKANQVYQVKFGPITEFKLAKQTANKITNKVGLKTEIIQNKQKV